MTNLIIGTAQFGMDYGITNNRGMIPKKEAYDILDYLSDNGMLKIDTASGYGNAEKILGEYTGINNFLITTKISIGDDIPLIEQVINSIENLNIDVLDVVLIHDFCELTDYEDKVKAINLLVDIKDKGLCSKVGVSVYEPQDTTCFEHDFSVDVIQIPLNIFNQEFIRTNELYRLQDLGIKIQVRSIFMQGVTLAETLPNKLQYAENEFSEYHRILKENKVSPLDASLGFVRSLKGDQDIIIAVDSLSQISGILDSLNSDLPVNIQFDKIRSDNKKFFTPSLWS